MPGLFTERELQRELLVLRRVCRTKDEAISCAYEAAYDIKERLQLDEPVEDICERLKEYLINNW